jgi:hypothetical protein
MPLLNAYLTASSVILRMLLFLSKHSRTYNGQMRVGGRVYTDTSEIILLGVAPLRKAEMF